MSNVTDFAAVVPSVDDSAAPVPQPAALDDAQTQNAALSAANGLAAADEHSDDDDDDDDEDENEENDEEELEMPEPAIPSLPLEIYAAIFEAYTQTPPGKHTAYLQHLTLVSRAVSIS